LKIVSEDNSCICITGILVKKYVFLRRSVDRGRTKFYLHISDAVTNIIRN